MTSRHNPAHTPLPQTGRAASSMGTLLAIARVITGGGRVLVVNTDPTAGRAVARVARTVATLDPSSVLVWAPRGWVAGLLSNWRAASRGLAAYAQYASRVEAWAATRGVASPATRRAARRYHDLLPGAGRRRRDLPWRAAPDVVVALGGTPHGHMARECRRMGVPLVFFAGAAGGAGKGSHAHPSREGPGAAALLALMALSLGPREPRARHV